MDCKIKLNNLISLLDLTLLDTNVCTFDIQALAQKAIQYPVAAICILPEHLPYLPIHKQVKYATVVNFPSGNMSQHEVLQTLDCILSEYSVDEIDYVFPYRTYLEGNKVSALAHHTACYQMCKQRHVLFKVILETGAFPSIELIKQASQDILFQGCDFLKTSTGKIPQGASLPTVMAIASVILDTKIPCGIKISGGIKTIEQAYSYIDLVEDILMRPVNPKWFRIGASSLLEVITEQTTPH